MNATKTKNYLWPSLFTSYFSFIFQMNEHEVSSRHFVHHLPSITCREKKWIFHLYWLRIQGTEHRISIKLLNSYHWTFFQFFFLLFKLLIICDANIKTQNALIINLISQIWGSLYLWSFSLKPDDIYIYSGALDIRTPDNRTIQFTDDFICEQIFYTQYPAQKTQKFTPATDL